jgi:hypothetical protein
MIRDFYIHLDETLNVSIQLLGDSGQPINMDNTLVQFAVSMELDTETIQVLSSANSSQIVVANANDALIDLYFKPTTLGGFDSGTHVYQLKVDSNLNSVVYLEGRLFISPSLFD